MNGTRATVTLTHRVEPKLAAELKRLAQREGTSANHEMTEALQAYVDADRKRRAQR